ncbi:MAG: outer membrane beta-barrel protein [Desulfuromonadaceae bacterium]
MSKLFLTCCLLLSMTPPVLATESDIYPYAGVTLGTALTSVRKLSDYSGSLYTDFNRGYMAGLTAGVAFNTNPGWNIEQIRIEAEMGYRSNGLSRIKNSKGQSADVSGTMTVKNLMINGYLDNTDLLMNDVPVNIFITAGAGVAMATISTISYQGITLVESANDTQLAYQGGLGVGYELTKKITLDATYRYMWAAPFTFAGVKADYGSHNILLGARYAFK